jgi:hypothetical protein
LILLKEPQETGIASERVLIGIYPEVGNRDGRGHGQELAQQIDGSDRVETQARSAGIRTLMTTLRLRAVSSATKTRLMPPAELTLEAVGGAEGRLEPVEKLGQESIILRGNERLRTIKDRAGWGTR